MRSRQRSAMRMRRRASGRSRAAGIACAQDVCCRRKSGSEEKAANGVGGKPHRSACAARIASRSFPPTPCDPTVEWRAMIGRLSGTLLEKNPPQLTLDVQGVAYEVDVPMSTFYNLPANGERVTLYTHLVVREDAHLLYGFGTDGERRAFRQLLKVNGIGAKIA